MFTMRFGMRSRPDRAPERADLYSAAIDMCEWAEKRSCLAAVVSQHHGAEDGYLPSPIPMAAAIAARTSSLAIMVAALLVAFYEPVKLAEDMAVVDLISRGRVSYVIGIGYRDEEFAAFGVDRRHRARLVEERIGVLRRLWDGQSVEVDGRSVRVTPPPFTPGGPPLAYGGGTEAAARRAARLGLAFLAERGDPDLEVAYRAESDEAGIPPVGCILPPPDVPLTVFVADDPERAWAEIGDYLFADAHGYAGWNVDRSGIASISRADSVKALEAEHGAYRIITPDQARASVDEGMPLALQPLVGGLPPDLAWPYLEAAVDAATPAGPRPS